jgi:predicted phage replisome organizer
VANDVKWIKITTDIFDDEKILMIESMPSADSIIVIWFKLLAFAGKQNNNGVFLMSNRIAYTDEMLACIFRRDVNTLRLALRAFEQFGMIEIIDKVITIPNWGKHQSLDTYEKRKQRDRIYQAERRAAQRALIEKSADTSADTSSDGSSDVGVSEVDKEEDKEIDIYKKKESTSCQQIVDLYHSICISFPKVRSLTEARKKAIKARLNSYSLDDFKTVFQNAEASSFLKGANDRNWTATFDWLIKDANMAKVLEGNYADKPKRYTRKEPTIYGASGELGDAELEAIRMMFNEPPETVESCPALAEQADELKRKMEAKYGKKGAQ